MLDAINESAENAHMHPAYLYLRTLDRLWISYNSCCDSFSLQSERVCVLICIFLNQDESRQDAMCFDSV